ncbi:MAG TPA: hypothetical protein PKE23_12990 [Anaerolineales bacterium]|nr:hypothetical protein [Anaerolineales bacterium]HND48465.1 hypothetical protein [Anaerolineales bacterium]
MSKLSPRMLLLAALVLILVVGAFTTYRAVSANSGRNSMGMYVLSGGLVNQLKPQQPEGGTTDQNQVAPFPGSSGEGGHGGCESENNINPSDL